MKESYSAGNLDVVLQSVSNTSIKSLDAVLARLKQISPLLQKMGGKTTTKFGGGFFGGSKNSGLSGFFNKAKLGASLYAFKRLGALVGKIAQSGAEYTETLNLWETSMGKNVNLATQFVNKMNDAYGISEKTLMNAQAIFKNMLGSLGQISDQTAYRLSEGVTQMAVDYASLYNVSFQKAFEKFQAALAGQVRPIRSVSGYDITENTLYQLYQSLGGTKSVRNLSRTEKQLLSLLAIFNQMTRSGAVGDLDKTMESYANQSRVMAEAWQQVMTYAGVLLTYTIQESGLLTYVNAILIFLGDTLKAVAESMGAIQHFGGDIFEQTTNSALNANDAIDQLNGKLLDFDKFRALNSSDDTSIGLDTRLLDALAGYDSILANAKNEAKELAESWKSMSGLFDKDGVFNPEKWNEVANNIETVAYLIIDVLVLKAINGLVSALFVVEGSAISLSKGFKTLLGYGKILVADFKRIEGAGVMLGTSLSMLFLGIVKFAQAWDDMGAAERAISIFVALAAAITATAIALHATHNWAKALMIGGMVAGGSLFVAGTLAELNDIPKYANGASNIDSGSLFIAGEAGKTEAVYSGSNGKTNVANVQQMEQAFYNALTRYGASNNGTIVVQAYLDGEKVYQNTTAHANKHGNHWA